MLLLGVKHVIKSFEDAIAACECCCFCPKMAEVHRSHPAANHGLCVQVAGKFFDFLGQMNAVAIHDEVNPVILRVFPTPVLD